MTKRTPTKTSLADVRVISLFSGCGGTDIALEKHGYSIIWANDKWDVACKTYGDNLKDANVECGDISEFGEFPAANLLVGCYPCQGYTQGGRRDWDAPINFLYREFDRVLRSVKPEAFVVENVIGMTFGANKERLQNQLIRYRSAGYQVRWQVLNAKDYGVAQNRRRVFIVGVRSDVSFTYDFPTPTHGPKAGKGYVSQADALEGLEQVRPGDYNHEPLHWYYLSRRRRSDWDEPSPCIVGHWRHVPLHPSSPPLERVSTDCWKFTDNGEPRRLSFRECAALQGFPKNYQWNYGSIREKFQMIGNAVPPPLFSAVLDGLSGLWDEI